MRRILLAAGASVLVAGPTALAFYSGGFFDRPRLVAGLAAWALVGVAAVLSERPLPQSRPGRLALGALALLAVWTALSMGWAPLGGRAEDDTQRLFLYLAVFSAALSLFDQAWLRRALEPLLALGALIPTAYGLAERLAPGLFEWNRSRTSDGRLEQPLTYWNASGTLAALGLVLAIRVAGDPRHSRGVRAGAGAGGVILALGVYLSFSRGSLAAAGVGILILLAIAPDGRSQLRSAAAVLAAGALSAIVASALPTVHSLERGVEGDPADGAIMAIALALLCGAAAFGAVSQPRSRHREPKWRLPGSRRRIVALAAAVILLGGAIIVAAEGTPKTVSPTRGTDPGRFTSADSNRYSYWSVALEMLADDPITGAGSGAFLVEWRSREVRVDQAFDAHSLYFETAAELGLVGLVLLAAFLAGLAGCARRLVRSDAAAATGLTAGLVTWAMHAGLDWDWEMPAVTLPALLLAGALVAWSERFRRLPEADERVRRNGARAHG